jgi:hypothetical protein
MNSPIGGRTNSKSAPRSRPSNGSGANGRPPIVARPIRQIVRVPGVGREFHLATPIEVIHDARAGLKIGVTALVARCANHRIEISLCVNDLIRKTSFATLPSARNPDRAGRGRGGAADAIGLLAKQHVQPLERTHQGRSHASCPSADNKHVDLARGDVMRRASRGDRHFPSDYPRRKISQRCFRLLPLHRYSLAEFAVRSVVRAQETARPVMEGAQSEGPKAG